MASGNKIVVTSNPKGKFVEGIVSGTPKPGTCMQLQAGTAPIDGVFTYEAYNPGGDGVRAPILVLEEDHKQGKTATEAYVTGTRIRMYAPVMGEELNVLVQDVSGTGDDFAIGDVFIVDNSTGKLLATTGTVESEPFIGLEVVTDPTADHLLHCMYTGY